MIPLLSLLLAATPVPSAPIGQGTPKGQPARISLRTGDSGIVRVRLTLAPNGTPTACAIIKSVTPALDRATCEGIMDRARFEPAAEEIGPALATYAERSVLWWR